MTEPRILVVTVGTSLFASASWACAGPLDGVPGYRAWTTDHLEKPSRRREDAKTVHELERILAEGTAVTWHHFTDEFDRPLRYSGELATMLRWSQKEGRGAQGVSEFLRRSYEEIELLAPTDANDPSHIAARHLELILSRNLGHPNVTLPGTLRSPYLPELIRHFSTHVAGLARSGAEVDFVVTGGYKVFSFIAGKYVATQPEERDWRALYLHEENVGHLIVERRMETATLDNRVLSGWPPTDSSSTSSGPSCP